MFKHTRKFMATKTITITEDAYNALAREKRKHESFSQVIRRTFIKKGDISRFIGAWKDMDEKTVEELHNNVEQIRKNYGKRRIKELWGK